MNERIKTLLAKAHLDVKEEFGIIDTNRVAEKFAELIVRECIDIAKNWEDELENSELLEESNAVGIVAYRIARQFGVKE